MPEVWPPDDLAALDAALAAHEAQVPNLRAHTAKRITWATGKPTQTDHAVVFVHGFSATGAELAPLPQRVAEGLGANLFVTRLTGHGQDGDAMGRMTLAAWMDDLREAFAIAERIGRQTILIACSTGCTLAALALAEGASAKGLVQVSPNYGLRHPLAQGLLDLPGVRRWGHFIVGRTRRFTPISDAHDKNWTLTYPTSALYTMAEAVKAARKAPFEQINTPTLIAMNEADRVISPKAARQAMDRWGGAVTFHALTPTATCDRNGHVMAGDILSPAQTDPLARRILDWVTEI